MIVMLSMEHCPKCRSAVQTLEQKGIKEGYIKVILPDNSEFMEVARELNIVAMPAFIRRKEDEDKWQQISLEEVITTLS